MRKRWFFRKGLLLIPFFPLVATGCRHGHRWHDREMRQDDLAEHLKDKAEWVLDDVDATDAQIDAVNGIVDGLAADLMPLKKEHRGVHERFRKVLEAERIDRQELEAVRRSLVETFDRASTRLAAALADVADVLTVEQRREIAAEWKERRR